MTKEQKNAKFGTQYQNSKWKSVTCKLTHKEIEYLHNFLAKKNMKYTEFIRFCINYFKDKNISKEYNVDDKN